MTDCTYFHDIFQRFYARIEKDEGFFHYYNVSVTEALQLAHDRAKGYLIDTLDKLSSIGNLQVDFSDYDLTSETINFKVLSKEILLIVDLMFQFYMERDIPLLHAFKINFSPSDLNVFSPANERNSYEELISRLETKNKIALEDYRNRDRITGKLKKTINYSAYSDY